MLKTSQRDCFLRKKNLSPMLELASVSEEIEMKTRPMAIKLKTKKSRGDFFIINFNRISVFRKNRKIIKLFDS